MVKSFSAPWKKSALAQAVQLELEYAFRFTRLPANPDGSVPHVHPASILIPYAVQTHSILLTQRTETVEAHKGQFAFPGGRGEQGESPAQTALREAQEEVSLDPTHVELLGSLPELLTVTGYRVTPFLGWVENAPEQLALQGQPEEIADLFWVPVTELFAPGVYRQETVEYRGQHHPVEAYYWQGKRIWGATAAMLRNLELRLHQLGLLGEKNGT